MKSKKSKLFLMLFVSLLVVSFTGCKDDDEETNYAAEIAGTYSGSVALDGNVIATDAEITMTRKSDQKITLSMNQTIYGIVVEIECESTVAYANNVYSIAGATTKNLTIAEGVAVPTDITVSGTINKSKQASLNIIVGETLKEAMPELGFPLTVVFTGTKQ